MMYTETTFLDAVFEYILAKNTDKIDGDAIKTMRAFDDSTSAYTHAMIGAMIEMLVMR